MTLDKKEKPEAKKTVFEKCVDTKLNVSDERTFASEFDNVVFLGNDVHYGDVFKAWNNGQEHDFIIYFGVKGSEFNN